MSTPATIYRLAALLREIRNIRRQQRAAHLARIAAELRRFRETLQ